MPTSKPTTNKLNGKCRFCGEDLIETSKGWGCSNFKGGCKAFIFKEDFYMQKVFGKKMTRPNALKLLKGESIVLKDVVVKGKRCDATISWGKKDDGRFGYTSELSFQKGGNY